jgi:hypothetical protein
VEANAVESMAAEAAPTSHGFGGSAHKMLVINGI